MFGYFNIHHINNINQNFFGVDSDLGLCKYVPTIGLKYFFYHFKNETIDDMNLFSAAKEGQIDMIEFLIESGGDINAMESLNCYTTVCPIHIACKFRQVDAINKLIELGCKLNFSGTKIQNPISALTTNRNTKYNNTRDIVILDILITNGCPLIPSNVTHDNGLIFEALMTKNFPIAKKLADYGAKIDDKAFDRVLSTENDELIQYFIGHGCDVNSKNEDGTTRLMRMKHCAPVIESLLRNGADPCICDNNGCSILNSEVYYTELEKNYIEEYLEDIGKKITCD